MHVPALTPLRLVGLFRAALGTLAVFFLPISGAGAQAAPPDADSTRGLRLHLHGYVQVRETWHQHAGLSASLNRARFTLDGAVDQHVTWRAQMDLKPIGTGTSDRPTASLKDLYVRLTQGRVQLTAGQFRTPFSMEYITSLSLLETANRSVVVDSLAPKRDVGVMGRAELVTGVVVFGGVFNGKGANTVTGGDSATMAVSRIELRPWRPLEVGVDVARSFGDSTRYGGDIAYSAGRVSLRGEYLLLSRDRSRAPADRGWFALGAIRPRRVVQLVARYQEFERPGFGAEHQLRAVTVGSNWFYRDSEVRGTLEWTHQEGGSPATGSSSLLAQVQVRF